MGEGHHAVQPRTILVQGSLQATCCSGVLRGAANNKTQPEENELDSAEQTTQLRPHTTIREVVQVHFVSPQPLLAAIDLQARFNGCILLP